MLGCEPFGPGGASLGRKAKIKIESQSEGLALVLLRKTTRPPEPERATAKRASTNQSQSTAGATGLRQARERTELRKKLWIGGRVINVMNVTLLTDLTKSSLRGP